MSAGVTIAEQLGLTEEERGWFERRKTGEITFRQQLMVGEIQTRALAHGMPEGPTRDALMAACAEYRAQVEALPAEPTVKRQGEMIQALQDLNMKAARASR
jgi:hypothetical protein